MTGSFLGYYLSPVAAPVLKSEIASRKSQIFSPGMIVAVYRSDAILSTFVLFLFYFLSQSDARFKYGAVLCDPAASGRRGEIMTTAIFVKVFKSSLIYFLVFCAVIFVATKTYADGIIIPPPGVDVAIWILFTSYVLDTVSMAIRSPISTPTIAPDQGLEVIAQVLAAHLPKYPIAPPITAPAAAPTAYLTTMVIDYFSPASALCCAG